MAEVWIQTDKEKEAIYFYFEGDANESDISDQDNVEIRLFYNGGNRSLKIIDNGIEKEYQLKGPKKPDDTPSELRFAGKIIKIDSGLIDYFPVIIERK